jgi:hypothetical protein
MTAALVRKCNKCEKPFLKDSGCNKMTCTCGNYQCYICSTDVDGYDHFGDNPGQCPLYDDTEERQHREVAVAQRQAVLDVLAARNDVTENELTVDQNFIADIREQIGQREREDLAREREEQEQEELERIEQLRLEEEARVAEERRRQWQLREQRWGEETYQRHLREWEEFVRRSEVLHRSVEDEQEITTGLSAEEIEIYWARKFQNVRTFAEDAKRFIVQNEVAFKRGELTMELRQQYLQAKAFLSQAERELIRFHKEAESRQKEARKRQIASVLRAGRDQLARKTGGLSTFWKRK